ncbi:alpha/beta hydrolase [Limnovirga soli]|uniref:BD-FAE-like domain-containing protein n=1 Tax=Limnovirga soli TaxID=2656915 RepID=A0A8J8FLP5_9BACT|nr:alpha/beta hydrolase [Limnovirga soli]NNV57114.1 hypothetical protein [Limnovirga soli]
MRKQPNLHTLGYFILFQLLAGFTHAQTINVCTDFCSKDLSVPISGITIGTDMAIPYGKNGTSDVFSDVFYKKNRCEGDIAGPTICKNDAAYLVYDAYYPSNNDYLNCKLPAVILVHGGSWDECSDYRNAGIVKLCQEFAKRGFVAFSIQYRTGVLVDRNIVPNDPSRTYTSAQQLLAIYRGCQDVRGAIRSIIKRQNDGLNVNYQINVNKLFIGGVSAGSVIALSTAYYQTQSQYDAVFPGISTSLGSIDRNFYDIDYPTYYNFFPNVKGVFDCWGGLTIPIANESNPYSFFSANPKKYPIIAFHGLSDPLFDYQKQYMYFSPSGSITNSETHCLLANFSLAGDPAAQDNVTLGSQGIYDMFKANGIPAELYLDCNMEHGLDDDCVVCSMVPNRTKNTCTPCTFDSDFGTAYTNSDAVYEYMVGRGATFFQTILGGVSTSLTGDSRFVDCKNNRVTCNTTDNNPGCANDGSCF